MGHSLWFTHALETECHELVKQRSVAASDEVTELVEEIASYPRR